MKTILRVLIFVSALFLVACIDNDPTGDAACGSNVCCEVSCGGNGMGPWCPACLPACDLDHGSIGPSTECK